MCVCGRYTYYSLQHAYARCMHTYLLVCAAAAVPEAWSRAAGSARVERSLAEQAVAVLIPERACVHLVITFSWFKLIDLDTLSAN
jgi:hypothetical protein